MGYVRIRIRKFEEKDVPNKVKWINDEDNNQFLHYDIPLTFENTYRWYRKNVGNTARYDAVIEYDGKPIGLIGLLSIHDGVAEYYVTIGESAYKGKGVAKEATFQILQYGFDVLGLEQIYLYTEVDNIAAQRLFERCGFIRQGLSKSSAMNRGRLVDRYSYAVAREEFMAMHNIVEIRVGGVLHSSLFHVSFFSGVRWAA